MSCTACIVCEVNLSDFLLFTIKFETEEIKCSSKRKYWKAKYSFIFTFINF